MNVIAHAILPALLAAPLLPRASSVDYYRGAGIVALVGALPDLLNPHLSLAARHSSWSHSVFALTGFALVLVTLAALRKIPATVLIFGTVAYALHLTADALCGGIAWLYPAATDVIGRRLIPFDYWFAIDGVLMLGAVGVFLQPPTKKRWSATAVGSRTVRPPAVNDHTPTP